VKRRTVVILGGIGICLALFAFAFIAAPHSCEWGATAYFLGGVTALAVLLFAPLFVDTDSPPSKRVLLGLGLDVIALLVWFAGLFVANVRILCRLF
jgi:hypothetical protein